MLHAQGHVGCCSHTVGKEGLFDEMIFESKPE